MASESAIVAEIDALWTESHADAKRNPMPRSKIRALREKLWSDNESQAMEALQPWLAISEFGLDWLAFVHLSLNAHTDSGPLTPECRAPWALVGAASSFGWSLRHACILGFDTPARAMLRTFVESLFLCLACLYDKGLGQAYVDATTDEQVVDFWHTVASPKNLHRRIIDIERSVGVEADVSAALTELRRAEYEVLSQSAHLSYLGAGMTCLPVSIESDDTHKVGILGRLSKNSIRTLSYSAFVTWYFSLLACPRLFGRGPDDGCLVVLNKEDENHRTVIIGRDILKKIVPKHWTQMHN